MRNLPTLHRTHLHRTVTGMAAAVALGSMLALSGCSGGGSDKDGKVASMGDQNPSGSKAPEAAAGDKGDMVKYAGCMREHGIDMPDPSGDGAMTAVQAVPEPGSPEETKLNDANNACRKWLPNGGEVTEQQKAEQREQSLKMAKCLREHGVNAADPGPDGGLSMSVDGDQAKVDAAMQACGGEGTGSAVSK